MSTDLEQVRENVRAAARAARSATRTILAYGRFHDDVAAIAIDLAEAGDPTSLLLLDAMKNLQAQTGEYVVSEETTDDDA